MTHFKLGIKLIVESDDDGEAQEARWQALEDELHGQRIAGDGSLMCDVLETLEQLVSIKRRAAARCGDAE